MAIPKIGFAKDGGPLSVGLEVLTPQAATYTFWLWEGSSNTIVMQERGNNKNPEDDVFQLPTPSSMNHRRLVEVTFTLIDPTGSGKYKVRTNIIQDDKVLDKVEAEGPWAGIADLHAPGDALGRMRSATMTKSLPLLAHSRQRGFF
jgi:hypothetical protein